MIHTLVGTISHIYDNKIVLMQSNIGFEVTCPQAKTLSLQQSITLYTYLHWSAEQGPSLFGFLNPLDKDVFLLIISCSGIGPKIGITILEHLSSQDFLQIICQEQASALSAVKGIGTKKAEQIIMQLKDKAQKLTMQHPTVQNNTVIATWTDLQQTLVSLNYSAPEIRLATTTLKEQYAGQDIPFDLLLRKALTLLAKK